MTREQLPPVETSVPILTEVIRGSDTTPAGDLEAVLAEVQTKPAARAFKVTEELLHSGFAELQATLFEEISTKLRERLPVIIDATLREFFETRTR